MRRNKILREMTIAVGVAAAVLAIGLIALWGGSPVLTRPAPRICVVDRVLVFERSAIAQKANAELLARKKRLQDAINSERASIDKSQDRGQAAVQMAQLLQKVQTENAQLEVERGSARSLIIQKIAPVVKRRAASSHCDIILDRAALVDVGSALDLTSVLVKDISREVPP